MAIRDTYFLKELELRDYDEQATGDDVVQESAEDARAEPPAPDVQPPVEPPAPAVDGRQLRRARSVDEGSSADSWSGALPSEPATPATSSDIALPSGKQSRDPSTVARTSDEAAGSSAPAASYPASAEPATPADPASTPSVSS